MSSGELAALITAIGVSSAAILTAIAALRNANYSAAKVKDLQEQIVTLQADNEKLKVANRRARDHSEMQDRIILDQQIKINKWQAWGQAMGRAFNVMQLEYGALMEQQNKRADRHATGPLPVLPDDGE